MPHHSGVIQSPKLSGLALPSQHGFVKKSSLNNNVDNACVVSNNSSLWCHDATENCHMMPVVEGSSSHRSSMRLADDRPAQVQAAIPHPWHHVQGWRTRKSAYSCVFTWHYTGIKRTNSKKVKAHWHSCPSNWRIRVGSAASKFSYILREKPTIGINFTDLQIQLGPNLRNACVLHWTPHLLNYVFASF